jgi:predicted amidohydrolase
MTENSSRRDFLLLGGLAAAGSLLPGRGSAAGTAGPATVAAAAPSAKDDWVRGGYYACALQTFNDAVHPDRDRESARERMRRSIARIDEQVGGTKRWIGPDFKLVVLPEYVLSGPPWGETIEEWADKAALDPDGPEYEALAAIAQKHAVFLAGNAYETDRHFPGLYFQASFCIDPAGNTVLRYRRLVSLFAPTPHDVWDRYLDLYGLDGVFPVARTAIGNLAAVASEEILYPEIARCLAIRGAEVLLHSTSEVFTMTPSQKKIARAARALENIAYVVSANTAGSSGIEVPPQSPDGGSEIVDYSGSALVTAGQGESINAHARLLIDGLRSYRRRPGMANYLSRQALDLFADSFARADLRRRNGLLKDGHVVIPDRSYFRERQADTIARMAERGLLG